jgi:hypothetical protein
MRLFVWGVYRVFGDGYMCRVIWVLFDECMRVYVIVLVVDDHGEEARVEGGFWAEDGV